MKVLKVGSSGKAVTKLQNLLKEEGLLKSADGIFGPGTRAAVVTFQKRCNLVADGIVGDGTWTALIKDAADAKSMSMKAMKRVAKDLSVPVASLKAFVTVESNGSGFFKSGHPKILYERHYMYRLLKKNGYKLLAEAAMDYRPDLVNKSWGGYRGGQHEVSRMNKAKELHPEFAMRSCSWGAFQIMGDHAERLGYKSINEFVEKMHESEDAQLEAVSRFIMKDKRLHNALKDQEWTTVARIYNGPKYAENSYDVKLAEAFERHSKK